MGVALRRRAAIIPASFGTWGFRVLGGSLLRRIGPWAAASALLSLGSTASAAVYSVGARTEAQAYQYRSWAGRAFNDPDKISRYQLNQYLDLGAFDLLPSRDGQRIDFVSSLRLENDFGFN